MYTRVRPGGQCQAETTEEAALPAHVMVGVKCAAGVDITEESSMRFCHEIDGWPKTVIQVNENVETRIKTDIKQVECLATGEEM